MNNEHPRAVEAREIAEARAMQKALMKKAIAGFDIHFHSVGNYTFCYRIDRRNVIEVSSALRHPADRSDQHTGRFLAFQRFRENNRMHMRVPNGFSVRAFLDFTFGA